MVDIKFHEFGLTEEGSNVVEFLSGKDSLSVDRVGGRISLRLGGLQILTSLGDVRGDGGRAVTHPCSPNFGVFGKEFGLPQHGPVRNTLLEAKYVQEPKRGGVLLSTPIEAPGYPSGVTFAQAISLSHGVCQIVTVHENSGKENVPLVSGEHFYWSTGPKGWRDAMVNENPISNLIKGDTVTFIDPQNIIFIPGYAEILLTLKGYKNAVYWAGKDKKGIFDSRYFCFEPAEFAPSDFGKPETLIKAGQTRTSVIQISLLRNYSGL